MATGRDVLKLIVDADSAGAVKEFDKLGKQIKSTVGDADKQVSGFTGKVGKAFDGLQAKSPMVSGLFDKLGVSSQQAASMIATALPAAGLAAAAGIGVFAVKSVKAFQDTALAADKFRDASGLGIEDASRWIAVADDVGVSATTFQSAFVKMEKAISTNRTAFGDLVATTSSGATDLNATFLNVIGHIQSIKDPIERANEASRLFGRGFAEVSDIIGTDADVLRQKLEDVADAQIINDAEAAKAREFEAAMDRLGESVGNLSIQLGGALVPALADAADGLAAVIEKADRLSQFAGGIGTFLDPTLMAGGAKGIGEVAKSSAVLEEIMRRLKPIGDESVAWLTAHRAAADGSGTAIRNASAGMLDFGASADAVAENIGNETDALLALNDALAANVNAALASFDSTFAMTDAQNSFNAAAIEANSTTEDQQAAFDDAAQAALRVATATVKYAEDQATLKGETLSAKDSQAILIDTLGKLAAQVGGPVATQLNGMITQLQTVGAQHPKPTAELDDQASGPIRTLQDRIRGLDGESASIVVRAETANAAAALDGIISRANRINGMRIVAGVGAGLATGVRNFQGGIALVGEKGPEIVHIPKGADVYTNAESRAMMSSPAPQLSMAGVGGGTSRATYVTINAGVGDPVAIGRAVKQAIAAAERVGVN